MGKLEQFGDFQIPEEVFKQIRKHHEQLWNFVNIAFPYAQGNLDEWIEHAIQELRYRNRNNLHEEK